MLQCIFMLFIDRRENENEMNYLQLAVGFSIGSTSGVLGVAYDKVFFMKSLGFK